jgi:hypothetical protein
LSSPDIFEWFCIIILDYLRNLEILSFPKKFPRALPGPEEDAFFGRGNGGSGILVTRVWVSWGGWTNDILNGNGINDVHRELQRRSEMEFHILMRISEMQMHTQVISSFHGTTASPVCRYKFWKALVRSHTNSGKHLYVHVDVGKYLHSHLVSFSPTLLRLQMLGAVGQLVQIAFAIQLRLSDELESFDVISRNEFAVTGGV